MGVRAAACVASWSRRPGRLELTVLPHDEHVAALVLRGKEDLWHHDEDLALAGGVDVPDALHVGGVVARVVGRLDVAHELAHLAAALPVWKRTDHTAVISELQFWVF